MLARQTGYHFLGSLKKGLQIRALHRIACSIKNLRDSKKSNLFQNIHKVFKFSFIEEGKEKKEAGRAGKEVLRKGKEDELGESKVEGWRKEMGGGGGGVKPVLSACHACQLNLTCLTFICYDLSRASRCIAVCNVQCT